MGESTQNNELRKLFSRQAKWTKSARDWLIQTKIGTPLSSVLEVGCGCGDVLHEVRGDGYTVGLDINLKYLKELKVDGILGDGHFLPFRDSSFDMVYCHFSLLWFFEPVIVIKEMARVAKSWICCMAEYDLGARLDYPLEFEYIRDKLADGIISDGGDPYVGRKLYEYFNEAGLKAEVGAYCHVMDHEQMLAGFESEWSFIQEFTDMDSKELNILKKRELNSIQGKNRFLFTPVFYALSKKTEKKKT
ncbi:MAG: methyltransferase domain-containing protein [Thermoplasmata archaeon]|nr:MAG: methyltransferase domain-containing protein [Thermoplasmata archaeon]